MSLVNLFTVKMRNNFAKVLKRNPDSSQSPSCPDVNSDLKEGARAPKAPLWIRHCSRWVISLLAKVFKPDLYKILNRFNSVFTVRHPELEERNNVILTLKIGGKLNYETLLSTAAQFIFECKKNGELLYPEFQMYWEEWLGFPFWKWEKDFKIKNHMKLESSPVIFDAGNICAKVDEDYAITCYENSLLKKTFPEGKSPWEIVFVEYVTHDSINETDSPCCWFLFFKFHHSLADGYSIFNFLMKCSDNNYNFIADLPSTSSLKISLFQKLWRSITFPFAAAYEIARLESSMTKMNPMTLTTSKIMCAEKVIVKSKLIPTADLKLQSVRNKSSFTAALISAISVGIQRYLKKKGDNIPEFILAQLPVPVPNRPEGLTNHFSMVCLRLPTGIRNSEKQRLQLCEKEITHARHSTYKEAMWLMIKLLGSIPTWLQKRMEHVGGSIEIATFPGPRKLVTFRGQPILDMHYNVICGQFALDLCILSYNGKLRIVANADPHIFPTECQLGDLIHEIEEEIGRNKAACLTDDEDAVIIEIV